MTLFRSLGEKEQMCIKGGKECLENFRRNFGAWSKNCQRNYIEKPKSVLSPLLDEMKLYHTGKRLLFEKIV